MSGPLLDRIDLQVEVGTLAPEELLGAPEGEASAPVRARCSAARDRALARQGQPNQGLDGADLEHFAALTDAARAFVQKAASQLGWSARATHRVVRVARTIADLAGSETTETAHAAEAAQYRRALQTVQR